MLGNFAVEGFLRAAPAIREVAMLESVRAISAERPGRRVFVDMPATGHGVAWLRVPAQLSRLLGSGPLFELTERLGRDLLSPGGAAVVIVTLPERLVLLETLDLWRAIGREVSLPARLLINRFPAAVPPAALADAETMFRAGGAAARAAESLFKALSARTEARAEALEMQEQARIDTGAAPLVLAEQRGDPGAGDVAAMLGEGAA